jgi:polyphosphate glucokinase
MNVLVVDIGGSNVKMLATGVPKPRRFPSSRALTPAELVRCVHEHTRDWAYDVVTIGYPGAVNAYGPRFEPGNLGTGWVGFDYERAFCRPVRVVNDAVMQAIGAYDGGRMLFLGLGTGVGSALITDHVAVAMDLGNLPWRGGLTLGEQIGDKGFDRDGAEAWERAVTFAVDTLRHAFVADYVVIGGGNAKRLQKIPHDTGIGGNHDAFVGGFRIWDEVASHEHEHEHVHDPVWRIVR